MHHYYYLQHASSQPASQPASKQASKQASQQEQEQEQEQARIEQQEACSIFQLAAGEHLFYVPGDCCIVVLAEIFFAG
jgi:hypothetical protein